MEPLCQGCRARRRRIAELEAERDRLRQQLEAAQRVGKRQAAPFSKGEPEPKPKRPGRKPGADYGNKAHRPPPPPDQIDDTLEAQLPDCCPDCGGTIQDDGVTPQYQEEIRREPIRRQINVHLGHCQDGAVTIWPAAEWSSR